MSTNDDVIRLLMHPQQRPAPAWRVRITFRDGSSADRTVQPAEAWPEALAARPPARFIARQTLGRLRRLRQELGLEAETVRIEPPPGTIDERGREVRRAIVLELAR
jgi:hypothetical protein